MVKALGLRPPPLSREILPNPGVTKPAADRFPIEAQSETIAWTASKASTPPSRIAPIMSWAPCRKGFGLSIHDRKRNSRGQYPRRRGRFQTSCVLIQFGVVPTSLRLVRGGVEIPTVLRVVVLILTTEQSDMLPIFGFDRTEERGDD